MLATTYRCLRFLVPLLFLQREVAVLAQDPALALEETIVKLIERIEPSVVSIARVKPAPAEFVSPERPFPGRRRPERTSPPDDPEDPDFQPNDFGAGIIISPPGGDERLVLTNYHVVRGGPVFPSNATDNGTSLVIRFASRRSCEASIIAADPRCDLAVLRLHFKNADMPATDLKPLDWSSSTPVRKGQFVLMLGNPHALARDGSASVSWGMISNLARRPLPWTREGPSRLLYRLGNLLQIDGRLNLGTSGGPVVNLKGELIGLTTSLAAVEGYEKSAGFAIPIDDLTRRIVKSLVTGQEVEYGMLGIGPTDVMPTEFRNQGIPTNQGSAARAESVMRDSPAERAGIRPEDVILRVAGETVLSEHDLMRLVGLHAPESEIELLVWRTSHVEPFPIKVRLGKWPVAEDEAIIETNPRFAPWRGLSIDFPTGREKYSRAEFAPPAYRRAVVVIRVADESPSHAAGLQPGNFISHVNKTPVQTPAEFHAALKSATGPVTLRLHPDRQGEGRTIIVRE